MPSHAHDVDPREHTILGDLTIEHLPWRDEPRLLWSAIGLTIVVAVCAAIWRTNLSVTAAALLLPALAAWRLWIPTQYRFTPIGIEQRVLGVERMIPWTAFGRFEIRPRGILLLSHADKSAISALRGLYIPWGAHRGDVLHQVEHHLVRG